ncbi:DUF3348 family protein [Ramlibacter sp. AW1]|uniref:DUF3348 family protein n=1 Tax=Ramlibacter aurantiacus TaxID=2801330 RepID=A0A937D5N7_9BURK|nr:DUF3348 family protein [Ramlibacter aurantiacus]MBL0422900.1 DUF3348 family protein [Ramlibacter aurantiacus]
MDLRSSFSSSGLVRLLGEWTPLDGPGPGMDFAERLSLWLDTFQAIDLQGVHQSARRHADAGGRIRPQQAQALTESLQRTRGALAHAIAQARPADALVDEASYAPYRQRHLALQRRMEQMVRPLREHARAVLAAGPATLRRLAELDAVLEAVTEAQEQALLPAAVQLLERRFDQLQQAHAADEPDRWREPDGWLMRFDTDWRQVLLAEVDLRLEPVAGLVAACNNERTTNQR